MTRGEWVSESEAWIAVGDHKWTLRSWKAEVLFGLMLSPFAFVFVVGLVTVVGWFL